MIQMKKRNDQHDTYLDRPPKDGWMDGWMDGRVVLSTCAGLLPCYFGLDWDWIGILCSVEQKHKRYAFLSYLFP